VDERLVPERRDGDDAPAGDGRGDPRPADQDRGDLDRGGQAEALALGVRQQLVVDTLERLRGDRHGSE
jgi:hypothetical protein